MQVSQNILSKISSLLGIVVNFQNFNNEINLLKKATLGIASLGYENVMFSLLFEEEMPKKIKAVVSYGACWDLIKDKTIRDFPGDDILAKVLFRKETKYVPNCQMDPEVNQEAIEISNIKSQIVVPLFIQDMLIGTMQIQLNVEHNRPGFECQLLEVLGSHISLSIHRIRSLIKLREADNQIMSFSKAAVANFLSSNILHQSYYEIGKINQEIDDILKLNQVNSNPSVRKPILKLKDNLNEINCKLKSTLVFNKLEEKVGTWLANDVIQDTIGYWHDDAKLKGCDLVSEYSDEKIFLNIRKSSLKDVLSCLIVNSLQAKASKIKIKLEFGRDKIGGCADEDCAIIRIKDNGIGISENEEKDIFKLGISKKDGGTGLGLTIVTNYVEQMEGVFMLEQKGKKSGYPETIFKINLPCTIKTEKNEFESTKCR